jgi:hypothetical protein
LGFLAYLASAPFVALFLTLWLALPIQFTLSAFGMPQEQARYAFPVLFPSVSVLTLVWAIRDYRRRLVLGDTGPPFGALRMRLFGLFLKSSKPSNEASKHPTSRGVWDREFDA